MDNTISGMTAVLVKAIAALTGIDESQVDQDASFMAMGIDSLDAMKLFNDLQKATGTRINPIIMFECHTINDLVAYVNDNVLLPSHAS